MTEMQKKTYLGDWAKSNDEFYSCKCERSSKHNSVTEREIKGIKQKAEFW